MTQIKILREQATHRIEMDLLRNSIVKTRQNWERNFNQRTDLKSRPPWSQLTQAERPFPTPPRARCSPRPYLLLGRGLRRGQSPRNICVVSDINKSKFSRLFSLGHLKNCSSGPGTTKIFLPCRDWKCCRGPRPAPFFFRPPTDHPSRRFQPAAGAACSSDKHKVVGITFPMHSKYSKELTTVWFHPIPSQCRIKYEVMQRHKLISSLMYGNTSLFWLAILHQMPEDFLRSPPEPSEWLEPKPSEIYTQEIQITTRAKTYTHFVCACRNIPERPSSQYQLWVVDSRNGDNIHLGLQTM